MLPKEGSRQISAHLSSFYLLHPMLQSVFLPQSLEMHKKKCMYFGDMWDSSQAKLAGPCNLRCVYVSSFSWKSHGKNFLSFMKAALGSSGIRFNKCYQPYSQKNVYTKDLSVNLFCPSIRVPA